MAGLGSSVVATGKILLGVDTKDLQSDLDAAESKAQSKGKSLGSAINKGALLAVGGLSLLTVGLGKAADAASRSQQADAKMESQLKALGISYDDHRKQIDAVLTSQGKLAGFDDVEMKGAFTMLVRSTGDVTEALKLNSDAADIARSRHISLEAAAKILARAHDGGATALKRLQVAIQPVTDAEDTLKAAYLAQYGSLAKMTPAEKTRYDQLMAAAKATDKTATSTNALAEVHRKYAGSAEAWGNTEAGAAAKRQAAEERFSETIGKLVLPAMTMFQKILTRVAELATEHAGAFKVLVGVLAGLAGIVLLAAAGMKVYNAGVTIVTAATKAWAAAQWLVNVAMEANPVILIVTAIVALIAILVVLEVKFHIFEKLWDAMKQGAQFLWKELQKLAGIVGDVLEPVWDPLKSAATTALDAITGAATTFADFFTKTIPNAFNSVLSWVSSNWPEIATIISGPFAPLVGLATNAFGIRDAFVGAITGIITPVTSFFTTTLPNFFTGLASGAWETVKSVGGKIASVLAGGITGGGQAAVDAVINIGGAIGNLISRGWEAVVGLGKSLAGKVGEGIKTGAEAAANEAVDIGGKIGNLASRAWDAVVGLGRTLAGKIGDGITGAWSSIVGAVITAAGKIGDLASRGWDVVKKVGTAIGNAIAGGVTGALGGLGGAISGVIKGAVNGVISAINTFIDNVLNPAIDVMNKIPFVDIGKIGHIPYFARGAVIDRPTIGVIGEAGREAVLPLRADILQPVLGPIVQAALAAGRAAGGGGVTVTQYFAAPPPDPHLYTAALQWELAALAP